MWLFASAPTCLSRALPLSGQTDAFAGDQSGGESGGGGVLPLGEFLSALLHTIARPPVSVVVGAATTSTTPSGEFQSLPLQPALCTPSVEQRVQQSVHQSVDVQQHRDVLAACIAAVVRHAVFMNALTSSARAMGLITSTGSGTATGASLLPSTIMCTVPAPLEEDAWRCEAIATEAIARQAD